MNLNLMDPKLLILAAVVSAWMYARKRRGATASLRKKFGSEYDRAVLVPWHGAKSKSEIRGIRETGPKAQPPRVGDAAERERFLKQWASVPVPLCRILRKGALTEADDLVSALMKARGYPVSDFRLSLPSTPPGVLE